MTSLIHRISTRLKVASRPLAVGASMVALMTMPAVAHAQTWSGTLSGSNENPANASSATGFVSMSLSGNVLSLSLNWSGLTGGNVTAGHIHCCTAPGSNVGVAVGFNGLSAAASGSYVQMFDLTNMGIYTGAFITNFGGGTTLGARTALIDGLNAGTAYVNLHNAAYPGGEIRANVVADAIVAPEPASIAMLGFGLAAVGVAVRRKRRVS